MQHQSSAQSTHQGNRQPKRRYEHIYNVYGRFSIKALKKKRIPLAPERPE